MLFFVWHSAVVCICFLGVQSLDTSANMGKSFLGDTGTKEAWETPSARVGDEYLQITIDRIPVGGCSGGGRDRVRRNHDDSVSSASHLEDPDTTGKAAGTMNSIALGKDDILLDEDTLFREEEALTQIASDGSENRTLLGTTNTSKTSINNNKRSTEVKKVFNTNSSNTTSSSTIIKGNKDGPQNRQGSQMRVLMLHPIYAGSHEMTLRALGEELAGRGHWVTQLRLSATIAVPVDKSFWCGGRAEKRGTARDEARGRMEVVTISPNNTNGRYPYMSPNGTVHVPTESLWSTNVDIFKIPWTVHRIIEAHCSALLGSPALLAVLHARRFTVAVVDLLGNDCGLALARLLEIPVLGSWEIPFQAPSVQNYGVYLPLGTVPRVMTGLGHDMTLWGRLYNVLHSASAEVVLIAYYWIVDYWIQKHQPGLPGVLPLLGEVDAIVINTHRSLDYPLHLPPHVHYIGCVLCREGRSLPATLESWVSNTTSYPGAVIMSFGFTGFDPEVIPSDFMTEVVKGLGQLPYSVILQFDEDKLDLIPSNVKVQPWIPQQDLLAHPRTRLLISHCGMKAVSEATYHGVPLLCVPIFADQGDVARRMQDRGLGLTLDRRGLTGQQLVAAAEAVMGEDRFAAAALKLSKMWKAEPETAMAAMVRWLETVHHFAPLTHLHPVQEHRLHLLQYTGVDAMAFLLLMAVLTMTMAFWPSLWQQTWQRWKVLIERRPLLCSAVSLLEVDGAGFGLANGDRKTNRKQTTDAMEGNTS